MQIGQPVLIRHNNEVKEGKVTKIWAEDLEIELNSGETVQRKFWEVRKINV